MFNFIYPYDLKILYYIHEHFNSIVLDKLSILIDFLGTAGLVWVLLSISLMLNKKYRKIGILILVSIALCGLFGEGILKNLVKRPRPFVNIPEINVLINKPHSYSFPSGHSSLAFAAATIIFHFKRKFGIGAIMVAIAFAFSRTYLFVHFPSDVLGGAILGISSALIVILTYKKTPFFS